MMKRHDKDNLKTNILLITGTLTQFSLIKSMTQSKTLTAIVIVGVVVLTAFVLFLMHMAGV